MTGNGTLQMPPQASTLAHQVDSLYYFIFWGSVFFFVLIVGLSTLFVLRYRRRAAEETVAPSASHNTPLEIIWTVIPLALVVLVFVWGFRGYLAMSVAPGNALSYTVVGKKWLWQVTHPNGSVAVNEMTVPLGQPVKLTLRSEDVIHSFYIPAFRVKQDALPNRYTTLWFEATQTGDFDLFCAEYCGTGHSGMLGKVHVLSPAEYEMWLQSTGGPGPGVTLAQWGEQLYRNKACVTCHSLDGSAKTGPSFKGVFGHPVELADGSTVAGDEEYIRRSILEPNAQVVKGYPPVMPTYAGTLKPEDIDALVEFIRSLQ